MRNETAGIISRLEFLIGKIAGFLENAEKRNQEDHAEELQNELDSLEEALESLKASEQ